MFTSRLREFLCVFDFVCLEHASLQLGRGVEGEGVGGGGGGLVFRFIRNWLFVHVHMLLIYWLSLLCVNLNAAIE